MNSGGLRHFLIGFWLIAVSVMGGFLLFEDRFFAVVGTPVARVGMAKNNVTYRSEEDTRWKFIGGAGQAMYDGDRIATGRSSSASIDFGDGRIANIGQDTTVTLSTIRQQNGLTYIISLPSGAVGVEKSKNSNRKGQAQFPIIVRSGGRDFYIEPNEEKAVVNIQKGPTEFKGKRVARAVLTSARAAVPTLGKGSTNPGPNTQPITPSGSAASVEALIASAADEGSTEPTENSNSPVGTETRVAPIAAISPVLLQTIASDLAISIPDPPPASAGTSLTSGLPAASDSSLAAAVPGGPASGLDSTLKLAGPKAADSKSGKPATEALKSISLIDAKGSSNSKPSLISAKSDKLAALSKTNAATKSSKDKTLSKEESKTRPPTPAPPTPVMGTEVGLDTSAVTAIYYSFKPLSQVTGSLGDLGLKNPATIPPGWRPILELSNGGKKKQITDLKGALRALKVEDFGALTANSNMDGLACADLSVRGGAQISDAAGTRVSVAKKEFQIKICSYRDSSSNVPLAIGVSSLEASGSSLPSIFPRPPANDLKFQVIVDSPRLYLALLPLMERSPNLRVGKVAGFSPSGIFIAKSGKIIMQLAGGGFTAKTADRMLKLTGGDFVYRGSRAALYDASSYSTDQLKDWVSSSMAGGRKVYVHRAGNLLPVSKDFLEERREVAAFVKTVSTQLFTEKVDIIAFR